MVEMLTGRVIWYNEVKRYGFVERDDDGSQLFVHQSALQDAGMLTLVEEQRVRLTIVEDKKSKKPKVGAIEPDNAVDNLREII